MEYKNNNNNKKSSNKWTQIGWMWASIPLLFVGSIHFDTVYI